MVDVVYFKSRYPWTEGLSDAIILSEFKIVEKMLNGSPWVNDPELFDTGVYLLTAHRFALEYRDQMQLGTILRTTEVARNIFDNDITGNLSNYDYYRLTVYGLQFLEIQETFVPVSMFVV